MSLWNAHLTLPWHLQQYQPFARAFLDVQRAELLPVQLRSAFIARHQEKATKVRPGCEGVADGTHHPAGEATALVGLQDEDIGQVREGYIVCDEAGKANELNR